MVALVDPTDCTRVWKVVEGWGFGRVYAQGEEQFMIASSPLSEGLADWLEEWVLVPPVGPLLGVAHVPSPRQNVELLADVPLLRLVTGRFPVMILDPPARFNAPDAGSAVPAFEHNGSPAVPTEPMLATAVPPVREPTTTWCWVRPLF